MAVQVDIEKCNACMKCSEVCPNESLSKANNGTKDHVAASAETCMDCFLCVEECPNAALSQP